MSGALNNGRTNQQLQTDNEQLRERLQEAEETLRAIRQGEVDSLVVQTSSGPHIFTLVDANTPYRTFVEEMQHGAVTLEPDGTILYCNNSLPAMLGGRKERIVGAPFRSLVAADSAGAFQQLLTQAALGNATVELSLRGSDGGLVPVEIAANSRFIEGIGSVCLVITDLTQRRAAQESAKRLAAIVESTENDFLRKLRKSVTEPPEVPRTELPQERRAESKRPDRATRIAQASAVTVMVIAALALLGWTFDITLLKSVFAGMVSMKANTALAFLFAGASCLMATFDRSNQRWRHWRVAAALATAALGALTMLQWLLAIDLGIDQLLFREASLEVGTIHPGRMTPWTALGFMFFGASLLLLDNRRELARSTAQTFAVLGCLFPILSFLGYVFGDPQLYGAGLQTHIAVNTDVAFMLLAVSVVSARWEWSSGRQILKEYGIAIFTVAAVLLVRWVLWPFLEGSIPFLVYWPALFVAAWYGGFRAGLLATLLTAIGTAYFLMDPRFSLAIAHPADQFGMMFFLILGAGQSLILERLRESERTRVIAETEALAIRAASAYHRSLLEASLDPLVTIGPDGKITDVNAATEKVTGRNRAQLVGSDFAEYFTEPAKARQGYLQVFREGSVRDYPLEIRHTEGRLTPVLYNAAIYRDEAGKVIGVFAAARDISERMQAEEAVRVQANRYSTLLATSSDGYWVFDADARLLDVNDVYCRMSGYSREEFLTKHIYDIDVLHTPAAVAERLRRIIETGFDRFETQVRNKDGRILDVEVSISYWRLKSEFLLFVRDISPRKAAEEAIRAQAEQYSTLLATTWDGYSVFDADARILDVNDMYCQMIGYSRDELLSMSIPDIDAHFTPEEVKERIRVSMVGACFDRFETQHRTKDGRILDVEVCASFWKLKSQFLQFVRDITERKAAEAALLASILEAREARMETQRLNAELEQRVHDRTIELEAANKELEAFAYSVSHDLRSPLRAIDGFSQILLKDYLSTLPEKPRHYIQVVCDNTRQMGRLIDDLLRFSRSGRQLVQLQAIAPEDLVRECLQELQPEREGRQIEIHIGELPECWADGALLKQVWFNLLSNALKYTRQRELAVIEIGSQTNDGETVYFVRDNGVGFDMQFVSKLFGVFQRLHAAEDYEGTGIGLALVQRILSRHGGRAWAEATIDQGATFYFTLGRRTSDA